jgi:hypothetical protein
LKKWLSTFIRHGIAGKLDMGLIVEFRNLGIEGILSLSNYFFPFNPSIPPIPKSLNPAQITINS